MEHSTNYVVLFVLAMTSLVAVGLTTIREVTKDTAELNEAIFNKRSILKAVGTKLDTKVDDMDDEQVLKIFGDQVQQKVINADGEPVSSEGVIESGYKGGKAEHIDMKKEKKKNLEERIFPVFVYNKDGENYHIISIRGKGLWDEIWASVAVAEGDKAFDTVVGATFDHAGETPGLGAEIKDNPAFAKMFQGKKLYDKNGNYTSVVVRKGGARNPTYEVDGITGATVTADGVTDMFYQGIAYYQPYFDAMKGTN